MSTPSRCRMCAASRRWSSTSPATSACCWTISCREGGELVQREFRAPARSSPRLRERTVVNCTGYGARELLGDRSVIPVRGQTARLVPQPEVDYALVYRGHNLFVLPRRDGMLVQAQERTTSATRARGSTGPRPRRRCGGSRRCSPEPRPDRRAGRRFVARGARGSSQAAGDGTRSVRRSTHTEPNRCLTRSSTCPA